MAIHSYFLLIIICINPAVERKDESHAAEVAQFPHAFAFHFK